MPTSALTMPQWSRMSALVMTVSTAPCLLVICDLPHAVADDFAAAEFHFFAVGGEILFNFDDQIGVGEPYAIACGRAEHVGVNGAADSCRHQMSPLFVATGSAIVIARSDSDEAIPHPNPLPLAGEGREGALGSFHFARNDEFKTIPKIIPTALHKRFVARFLLHRATSGVWFTFRSLAFGSARRERSPRSGWPRAEAATGVARCADVVLVPAAVAALRT